MDDIRLCPICGNKFSSRNTYSLTLDPDIFNVIPIKQAPSLRGPSNYTERVCTNMNHSILIMANKATHKIDFIKMSLNPKYSKYIEIDFYHNKCRISCLKNGNPEYIEVPQMITPDFPDLVKLREKVLLYVTFS